MSETKQCIACREVSPLTPEFFHREKASRDGFSNKCKRCANSRAILSEIRRSRKTALHPICGPAVRAWYSVGKDEHWIARDLGVEVEAVRAFLSYSRKVLWHPEAASRQPGSGPANSAEKSCLIQRSDPGRGRLTVAVKPHVYDNRKVIK